VTDDLDNFSEGTLWRNNQGTSSEVDDTLFQLLDDTDGAAVWIPVVRLAADGTLTVSTLNATTLQTGALEFEGATADAFETTLDVVDPTQDNTITLPDTSGTVALTSDIPAEIETLMLTIDAVADSMNYGLGFVSAAFTISEIRAVHVGTLATPDIDIDIRHSTDRSAAGNQVEATAMTITSSTTGDSFTSGFEDATVPANSWIWVETSSISGTTDNLEVVVRGTYD
jgi:hypothetical protein